MNYGSILFFQSRAVASSTSSSPQDILCLPGWTMLGDGEAFMHSGVDLMSAVPSASSRAPHNQVKTEQDPAPHVMVQGQLQKLRIQKKIPEIM